VRISSGGSARRRWRRPGASHRRAARCGATLQKPHRRSRSAAIRSRVAPHRAARRWLAPVGAIAASPLPPDEMRTHIATLKQMTEAEGRDFKKLTISYKAPLYDTGVPDRDGRRPQLLRHC